jgi:dihydroorotase
VLYKCGWSPFDGHTFQSRIESTWVNGYLAWDGKQVRTPRGMRLRFKRR